MMQGQTDAAVAIPLALYLMQAKLAHKQRGSQVRLLKSPPWKGSGNLCSTMSYLPSG